MAPSVRPRGYAAHAIEEALEAVAALGVRDAIVAAALSRSGELAIPDGKELVLFVRGPLRSAIVDRLGVDVADEVLEALGPLAQRIASRPSLHMPRRPSARRAAVTAPPPGPDAPSAIDEGSWTEEDASGVVIVGKTARAGDFLPVLLVVSNDVEWTRALSLRAVGRAIVRRVAEIFEMMEAIEDHRADLPVVLFDCANAPFHLESVATFASELPPGSWLALHGPQPADDRIARDFAGTTLTVARIRQGESVAAIVERCLSLTH